VVIRRGENPMLKVLPVLLVLSVLIAAVAPAAYTVVALA
jgi:hypothetical protein